MVLPNGLRSFKILKRDFKSQNYMDLPMQTVVPICKLNYDNNIFGSIKSDTRKLDQLNLAPLFVTQLNLTPLLITQLNFAPFYITLLNLTPFYNTQLNLTPVNSIN